MTQRPSDDEPHVITDLGSAERKSAKASGDVKNRDVAKGCAILVGVGVVLVGIIWGIVAAASGASSVIPDGWGWGVLACSVVLLLTALVVYAGETPRERLVSAAVGLLIAVIGLFVGHIVRFLVHGGRSAGHFGSNYLFVIFVVVVVLIAGVLPFGVGRAEDAAGFGLLVRVVLGVCLMIGALGVFGLMERNSGAYTMRYGVPVTVYLGDECGRRTTYSNAGVRDTTSCDGEWSIDNVRYTGRVMLDFTELTGGSKLNTFTTTSLDAYVVPGDDTAYTKRAEDTKSDHLTVLGKIPWWTSLLVPLIGVGYLVRHLLVRRRSAS